MMQSGSKTAIYFGAGILVALVGISLGLTALESPQPVAVSPDGQVLDVDKSRFKMAPELVGISGYINTMPEQLGEMMEDKVVLYDIWTYSCINCLRTLPYITAWDAKYSDEGLLIIGVHSPEFEFEKDIENVKVAVDKYGIEYPVILDNDKETWKAFENRYWPRKYIADHEGYVRYDHIGEGAYDETEKVIQTLLEERAQSLGMRTAEAQVLVDLPEFEHTQFRTPELYLGYKFAQGRSQIGNDEGFRPGSDVAYSIPDSTRQDYFYLDGTWSNLEDGMRLVSESGEILLTYSAKQVNIVAGGSARLEITLDGEPLAGPHAGADVTDGIVEVVAHDLYNIVESDESGMHTLHIKADRPGFEIFTYTFG